MQFFIVLLVILLAELILLILFFVYMDKVSLARWEGAYGMSLPLGLGQAGQGPFPGQRKSAGKQHLCRKEDGTMGWESYRGKASWKVLMGGAWGGQIWRMGELYSPRKWNPLHDQRWQWAASGAGELPVTGRN